MSENMNDTVEVVVNDAEVITVPIDDTLSNSGEAADAAAVGAALALKADASSVVTISVDGEEADAQGVILINGTHIPVDGESETTIAEVLGGLQELTAEDIPMSDETGAESVADAVGALQALTAETIPMNSDEDAESVAEAIADAVAVCTAKTAADIAMSSTDSTKVKAKIEEIETAATGAVKTINGETADAQGNIVLNSVPYSDNLLSSGSQNSEAAFLIRSSGGDASVADGDARISRIRGNMIHTGFTAEVLDYNANGENFDISLDRATFLAEVEDDDDITLTYTTEWDTDPATYGITISGTPEDGDTITIHYIKEVRGEITPATPQMFISTGWNLFNRTAGYARVVNYSETYGFRVGGTFTSLAWSETVDGTQYSVTVTNRNFSIPGDGYIFVTGADATTEIYMTWSDWGSQANGGVHKNYSQSVINLAGIMSGSFPDGLLKVGEIADEINFGDRRAYSRIERIDYSAEARAEAEESGRDFVFDEDYIYIVREAAVETALAEGMGKYTVNGHGMEMIDGTEVAPEMYIVYSNDLKNKLERDVLTISQQSLTNSQKTQVRNNIGALGTDTNNLLQVTMVRMASAESVPAGTLKSFTVALSKTGYKPVGVVGWNTSGSGSSNIVVTRARVSDDGTEAYISLKNVSATGDATITATFRILWLKQY